MKLNIYNTVDELLLKLAEYVVVSAKDAIAKNGRFSLSLSGGSSPEKLYQLLASDAFKQRIDWSKVDFFFGDERYVPATDAASNFKMVNTVLFEPLQIDPAQQFAVNTSLTPEAAAANYMDKINTYFNGKEPRFDLVLLGLGDNSHTASLFPFTNILHETEASIKAVFLTEHQVFRISFTAPLINLAHRIAFLVYGEGKSRAVLNILEGAEDIDNFPAQLIKPTDGEVEWFLDKAAASLIDQPGIAG